MQNVGGCQQFFRLFELLHHWLGSSRAVAIRVLVGCAAVLLVSNAFVWNWTQQSSLLT